MTRNFSRNSRTGDISPNMALQRTRQRRAPLSLVVLLLPDAGPLITLAYADALDLIHRNSNQPRGRCARTMVRSSGLGS